MDFFCFCVCSWASFCSKTGESESNVWLGQGNAELRATLENATKNVVINSLFVTLFLVAAFICIVSIGIVDSINSEVSLRKQLPAG